MSLSVSGRTQLASLGISGTITCVVQDWDDLDTFYFTIQGATWKVYRFTWPETLVEIVDLGARAGKSSYKACMDYDFSSLAGDQDTTKHYCLAIGEHGQTGGANLTLVDVNLSAGTYTEYASTLPNLGGFNQYYFDLSVYSYYDEDGTHFFTLATGTSYSCVTKRYGAASGTTQNNGTNFGPHPIFFIDYVHFVTQLSNNFGNQIPSGLGSASLLGSSYLPTSISGFSSLSYFWLTAGGGIPRKALEVDFWRYFFVTAYVAAGGDNHLLWFRKNVASGQYSYVDLGLHDRDGGGIYDALDIAETDETTRAYFVHSSYRYRVYGSAIYPLDLNTSVDVDNSAAIIAALYTNPEDAAIYAFHASGAYGGCITKIADTELVAEEDEAASISATGAKVLYKDQRVFFIKVPGYGRYLWWSGPFELETLDPSWDGYNSTVFEEEDNTALLDLEDSVYIGCKRGWKRLRGKSPDHWSLDKTSATIGPETDKTVAVTPYGAIYPRRDGLYLFNGYTNRPFCEQAKPMLADVNWDEIDKAFSLWDGRYVRFFYPKDSATTNNRELIIDLIGGIDLARATEGDRAASAGFFDFSTQTLYLGSEDGKILVEGSSGSRTFSLTSKEFPTSDLKNAGTFALLHYDMDNKGVDVTITPVYDGVDQSSVTIPGHSGRKRSQISLPKGNAYRVGIKIAVTTTADIRFYEPWYLE